MVLTGRQACKREDDLPNTLVLNPFRALKINNTTFSCTWEVPVTLDLKEVTRLWHVYVTLINNEAATFWIKFHSKI